MKNKIQQRYIYIYTYIQNKKNRETKILCMLKFKLYYDIPGLRYF